ALNDDGTATCPLCQDRVPCGPSGLGNFRKRHAMSGRCVERQSKLGKKKTTPGSILGFLRPKPAPVPSTVNAPALIRASASSSASPASVTPKPSASTPSGSSKARFGSSGSLLATLESAIKRLPATVKTATATDELAAFGNDPAGYLGAAIPADEVFENLNGLFHRVLGWSMPVHETAALLRRGDLGLDGLLRFLAYFVQERGVPERDFGAKIQQILDAIQFL
ncbi:hypothetical protein GGX14DRAFT_381111, partial [Mycena pura]